MLRNTLKRACGFGLALRVLCMPWLLLLARIWFGQVVFVHQIMTMAESPHGGLFSGAPRVPSGLDAALHSVVPLLLTIGLLTRPVALVLLIETIADSHGALAVGVQGAKLALLSWLIVSGARFVMDPISPNKAHAWALCLARTLPGPASAICHTCRACRFTR